MRLRAGAHLTYCTNIHKGITWAEVRGYLERDVAKVKAAGVTVNMGPIETPVCHMLMISDPDGSPLIIHKRKPGHN